MKYKVGDKVRLLTFNATGIITEVLDEHYKDYHTSIDDSSLGCWVNEDEIELRISREVQDLPIYKAFQGFKD